MKLFRGIDSFEKMGALSVTVGSFDGVHAGHRSLLKLLCDSAKASGRKSLVVSFSPHPRIALGRAEGLKLLSTERERAELIASTGVDAMLLIDFDESFSRQPFEEFVERYLIEHTGMKELVVGYDHRLGHNGAGFDAISKLAERLGFIATQADEYSAVGEHISSTVVRRLITCGEIERANNLLDSAYLMIGEADADGFVMPSDIYKLLPPVGDYLARVNGEESHIEVVLDGVKCLGKSGVVKIEFLKKIK